MENELKNNYNAELVKVKGMKNKQEIETRHDAKATTGQNFQKENGGSDHLSHKKPFCLTWPPQSTSLFDYQTEV